VGVEEVTRSEVEVIDEEVENVEVVEVQIAFWFPQGFPSDMAVTLAILYSYLVGLAIAYQLERQRIIEEYKHSSTVTPRSKFSQLDHTSVEVTEDAQ
jgi:hypothetical protein